MAGVQGFVGAQHATLLQKRADRILIYIRALVIGIFNRMVGSCRGAACYALSPCGRGMFSPPSGVRIVGLIN